MMALGFYEKNSFSKRMSGLALALGLSLMAGEAFSQHSGDGAHREFHDPAAYTESWDDPARDEWQRPAELVAALGVRPGMMVADIGTGTGYLLPHLSSAVGDAGSVYAVDVSPEMLSWVGERAQRENLSNIVPTQAQGNKSGLQQGSIDRAIMINVWHHVENQDDYAADLFASLRAGGVLFIVEAKPDASQDGGPPAHFRMQPDSVVAQLERAGFEAQIDDFAIDRQFVIRAVK